MSAVSAVASGNSYTFTVLDDMITTHASTNINLAFRLYNGFGGSTGAYYPAQVYIDDVRVYEELNAGCTTRPITDFAAVSGSGISTDLTVYADDSATGAPEIYKTYLAYNPTDKKIRFDVIEVYYDIHGKKRRVREINHLESAFDLNTAKGHKK